MMCDIDALHKDVITVLVLHTQRRNPASKPVALLRCGKHNVLVPLFRHLHFRLLPVY